MTLRKSPVPTTVTPKGRIETEAKPLSPPCMMASADHNHAEGRIETVRSFPGKIDDVPTTVTPKGV